MTPAIKERQMIKSAQENNAAAKRGLASANAQIAAVDAELNELLEKLVAGTVTELFVKVRELTLRERRAQAEAIRNAMISAIKDF